MFICPDCFADKGLKRRIVALRPGEPHRRCDFHPRKNGIALSAISPILSELISNTYRHADDAPPKGTPLGVGDEDGNEGVRRAFYLFM